MKKIFKQVLIFFIVDFAILVGGMAIVFLLFEDFFTVEYLCISFLTILCWIYIFYLKDFYRPFRPVSFLFLAYHLFEAILIGTIIPVCIFFCFRNIFMNLLGLIVAALTLYSLVLSWRYAYYWYIQPAIKTRNTLILGSDDSGQAIAAEIRKYPEIKFNVIGFVDDDPAKKGIVVDNLRVIGSFSELPDILEQLDVQVLILAIPPDKREKELQLITPECIKFNVELVEIFDLYSYLTGKLLASHIACFDPVKYTYRPAYELIKRILDVIVAILITIFTIPLMLAVAIAIKFHDGGRVLYFQNRVGKYGNIFKMLKFRTMFPDAEINGAVWSEGNEKDPRATNIGRIIRKLRFDELPQMYNVIKGNMSLVGPRPERPEFTEILEKKNPFYSKRHSVLPGWAGWAQVKYKYTANVDDAFEKLSYDLYYIQNRSIFLDVNIWLLAIAKAISGRFR